MSKLRDNAEAIGGCLLYILFAAIPLVLVIAFFKSTGWVMEVLLPKAMFVTEITVFLIPVVLLFAIPRIIRGWAGLCLFVMSYLVGFGLWLWCFVLAVAMAGVFWTIVGLLFAGVGVVAVAAVAALFHGEWSILGQIVFGVVVVYVLRLLGPYLIEKSEPKEEYIEPPPLPPDFADE